MHQIKLDFHCYTVLNYGEAKFVVSEKRNIVNKHLGLGHTPPPLPPAWAQIVMFFLK